MKNINTITQEINAAAVNYRMRDFQEIRRQIHGLSRTQTRNIFTAQTINDDRAFHSGGRKEIQFNIGLEGAQSEWLRYGLAFSLEPSQTLPDPMVLEPKVLKLNEFIRENQSELEDIRFWYYYDHQRSATLPVTLVSKDLIRVPTFLFLSVIGLNYTRAPARHQTCEAKSRPSQEGFWPHIDSIKKAKDEFFLRSVA